ncbi:hypothetical protein PTKIN_Ptkin04bG0027900 [Pterospermum kingtungense]
MEEDQDEDYAFLVMPMFFKDQISDLPEAFPPNRSTQFKGLMRNFFLKIISGRAALHLTSGDVYVQPSSQPWQMLAADDGPYANGGNSVQGNLEGQGNCISHAKSLLLMTSVDFFGGYGMISWIEIFKFAG